MQVCFFPTTLLHGCQIAFVSLSFSICVHVYCVIVWCVCVCLGGGGGYFCIGQAAHHGSGKVNSLQVMGKE